jgi:hypothetical protein
MSFRLPTDVFSPSGRLRDWLSWSIAILLIFWNVWTAGRALRSQLRFPRYPTYIQGFSQLYDRYDHLRGRLPADQTIGYASPFRPTDTEFGWRQALARYTLTPLILDDRDQHPLVIADFNDDAALSAYVRQSRGRLLAHPILGLGIVEMPEGTR